MPLITLSSSDGIRPWWDRNPGLLTLKSHHYECSPQSQLTLSHPPHANHDLLALYTHPKKKIIYLVHLAASYCVMLNDNLTDNKSQLKTYATAHLSHLFI